MSSCPDAIRCEARINDVLQQVSSIAKVRMLHMLATLMHKAQSWAF